MSEQQDAMPGNGDRQPFSSPGQGFFTGADRRTHLEQLRHLSQWSRRVLLVTGPRGVGKSTLYRQLSASLEPRAKAARINAALVSGARDVLNAMVHGFGLAAPADADITILRDLVAEHAEAQERADRLCVVLMDDADLLESRTLEQLLTLSAAAPVRLVLFGEIRLVPAVERAADSCGVDWHEIRLSGFTVDDVRRYLAWRLEERGFTGGPPFTDAQVREIARLSEGLPGRIDQMANVLLAKIQSGGGRQPARRQFPVLHQALLAVLIVFLSVLYVIWPTGEQVPGTADVERVDVPPPAARQEAAGQAGGASGEEPAVEEPALPATEPRLSRAPEQPEATAPESAEPVAEPDEPEPAAPEAARGAEQQAPVSEAPPVAQAEPEAEPEPEREPEPAAAPVEEAPPDGAGVREGDWIMRQPASHYTLQLVIFSTDERTDEYLAEQADASSFARFRIQQDGRILHVVTYGAFETRSEAEQASTRLPESVGGVQPWIRTFGQLQERVRTALQQ